MADISKITTLDGTEYNIKDATARSLISNLPANNLQNLVDGSAIGSVRGIYTSAENNDYTMGNYAFTEGLNTKASGVDSHAEGTTTTASGSHSHAEGRGTIASAETAHAEGTLTTASESSSHAEGEGTTASGSSAHAEGGYTTASGSNSHAEGSSTIANHLCQHVFGKYNIADDTVGSSSQIGKYIEIVGNGTSNNERSNARTLDWDGNEWLAGGLTLSSRLNIYGETATDATLGFQVGGKTGIPYIRAVTQADTYNSLAISGAAALFLGSGEAAGSAVSNNLDSAVSSAKENLYLLADNELAIYTGCNTFANAVQAVRINSSGEISTDITMSKSSPILSIKNTARIEGTAPSANQYGRIRFFDKDDNNTAYIASRYTTAKRSDIQIGAQGFGTGSGIANELRISVADDGTRTVGFSEVAPWRAALGLGTSGALPITVAQGGTGVTTATKNQVFAAPDGSNGAPSFRALVAADIPTLAQSKISGLSTALDGKVATAGDTMTGNLSFTGTHGIYENHASCVVGTAPSSTAYNIGYRFRDKNSTTYGYLRGFFGTDNGVGMQFEVTRSVSGSAKYHNLTLRMKADGTRQVTVSEQEPWLVGLGLSQEAVTITKPTTTPSGISTNGTFRCYTAGHVVMVQWESLLTTASPATSWTQLATGFPNPSNNIYFEGNCQNATAGNRMRFRITTGGVLQYAYGTPSATHAGTMTYIIP